MNINQRFAAIVTILVAGCLLTGASGFYGLTRMGSALATVVNVDMKRFSKVTDVRKMLRSFLVTEQSYILESAPEKRAALEKDLEKARAEFKTTMDDYERLALASNHDKIPLLRAAYQAWENDDVQVLALARAGKIAEAYALSSRKKTSPTWEELIKGLITADQKVLSDNTAATFQVYDFSRGSIVAIGLGSILIGLGAGVLIFRAISRSMLETLRLKNDLAQANVGLERKVEERTKAIRTILDHVSFGLFICDPNMQIESGYSRATRDVLAIPEGELEGRSLLDVLALKGREADHFEAIYRQIFDPDFLLGALGVDQLPSRFELATSVVGLTGSVISDDAGRPLRVLFSVADIANLVEAEDEIARNRSLLKMLSSKDSARQFVTDVKGAFARIRAQGFRSKEGQALARRELHTIKGNLGVYGLTTLANAVHHFEDDAELSDDGLTAIETAFSTFLSENRALLGPIASQVNDDLTITTALVDQTESRAAAARTPTDLRRLFQDFFRKIRQKPARSLLGPIEDSFAQLANRLGKNAVLVVEGGDTLVPQGAQDVFKNLTHLLRNAIDHGIESAGLRGAKPEAGRVIVGIAENEKALVISVEDDGNGLDAKALRRKAVERGLLTAEAAAALSDDAAFNLIFVSGFSTAETVTDVSGRGVGMSAVMASVEAASAALRISSQKGRGTRFEIEIPKEATVSAIAA